MGRDPSPRKRRSLFPPLALLFLAGVAAVHVLPRGTSVPTDRVRAAIGLLVGRARAEVARALPAAAPDAPPSPAAPPVGGPLRTVVRVVDGDTVVLDGNEKVRLVGIDTPESVDPRRPVEWFGKEAAARTRALLEGRRVRLEYDAEPRDHYGRTLAYLHREDGLFVNLALVEEGYAAAYRYPPNVRHADRFREAERRAREGGKGLWSRPERVGKPAPR